MNKTTLRSTSFAELDANSYEMIGSYYTISETDTNLLLEYVTRVQGETDQTIVLPLSLKDSLLAAYDNNELDNWMHDHAEELMNAPTIEMQTVY